MKIALICPSNLLYMPYVSNYENILKENEIDYDIINWDRFSIEKSYEELIYRDSKIGHQRNFYEYNKFFKFIIAKLNSNKYDKVIVFGIQLAFFLKNILRERYKGNYIVDIRDYNKIIHFFNINKVVQDSFLTVLSSPGFQEWLPKKTEYTINHNTQISNLNELKDITILKNKEKFKIAYIGAIRDYKINMKFINSLKNSRKTILNYHGEGSINKNIQEYIKNNKIDNVYLTGRYKKDEEAKFYRENDIINVLRYNDGINNRTALPNRLYKAAIYGKVMLGFSGTDLAKQIQKHDLGIVIKNFDNIEDEIIKYNNNFDLNKYLYGREEFFSKVISENLNFVKNISNFIKKR